MFNSAPQYLPWLALTGPLAVLSAGLVSNAKANLTPGKMASRCLWAAGAALAVALAVAGAVIWFGTLTTQTLGWAGIGFAVHLDALSAIMFVLVSFIGVVVLRFSRNYLAGDPDQGRFFKLLSLTLAAVLTLIISGNLAQLIGAWLATSIGLGRLLLFYGNRPAARLAAKKKFLVSRIGDACLLGAAILLFSAFGTLEFTGMFAQAKAAANSGATSPGLEAAALLIVVAALLKSAQLPVHGWLIDVMETPTPVSALLHAGIINAGGFLVLRLADIVVLSSPALETLVVVGGATALFGSIVMLTQSSVKASLAYSTVAQMGFMMLQCGLGAFPAALLHIVAHSLYKAHSFLSSGSIIDLARASWTPSPSGQPHPARLIVALVVMTGLTLVIGWTFSATLVSKPGAIVLGAILSMGLVHLMANAIDERPNGFVIAKAAVLGFGVLTSYFILQIAVERLTSGSLPAIQPLRGMFDLAMIVLATLSFGFVTVAQSMAASHIETSRWHALYVHFSQGLYLDTMANRLVLRLWPARPNANPNPTLRRA